MSQVELSGCAVNTHRTRLDMRRLDGRSWEAVRIRALEKQYRRQLGLTHETTAPFLAHMIKRAAELNQIAEEARAAKIRGEVVSARDLVLIEQAATRALRVIGLVEADHRDRRPKLVKPQPAPVPTIDDLKAEGIAAAGAHRAARQMARSIPRGTPGGRTSGHGTTHSGQYKRTPPTPSSRGGKRPKMGQEG